MRPVHPLVRWLYALIILTFTLFIYEQSRAQTAGLPVPTCKPAPIGTGTAIQHATNSQGWALIYYCDEGHTWVGYGSAGFWSDVPGDVLAKITAFFKSGTASDVDTYFASLKCNLKDPACPQNALLPLFLSIPGPGIWPPSGLVTITPTAYKARQAVNGFTFVAIGTAPVGTSCDTSTYTAGYFVIPRASVTLASKFDTVPLLTYGKCQ